MLGPRENRINEPKSKKKQSSGNQFKPEDIITNFKEPTWYFRPVQEWIDNINTNSATWKVISVAPNGDYTLQRLDTLTTKRILEDDGPIYQKEQIMRKTLIDNGDYRLWAKVDVNTIYNSILDKAEKEKEANDRLYKDYNDGMINYFETRGNKSIAETADQYNLTNEEILDALGDDKLKGATDYKSVKDELLSVANLPRAEAEYLNRSKSTPNAGGKKTKKKRGKSKKRGRKTLLLRKK
jgi:hypothetical protein